VVDVLGQRRGEGEPLRRVVHARDDLLAAGDATAAPADLDVALVLAVDVVDRAGPVISAPTEVVTAMPMAPTTVRMIEAPTSITSGLW
jgi:hypothetical protein